MVDGLQATRLDLRSTSGILVLLGVVLLTPYLIAGPGHFVDDWFALRNARLGEWWDAAGDGQWRARPGAGAIYALTFGLLGARPWAHVLVASVLVVASALTLNLVLRRFVPAGVALATSVMWLLVPNHTSLEMWPSAVNITAALLLLLLALERLSRVRPTTSADLQSAALLGLSVLSYEATAPAGAVAVLVVAFRSRNDRQRAHRVLPSHGIVLACIVTWMLANWHEGKTGLDVWIDPLQVFNGHFSTGVVGDHAGAPLLGGIVLLVTLVAVYLDRTRPEDTRSRWPVQFIGVGWAVVILGALPFVRYFYSPLGLGDRVTVVSGLGGAAVLVGVLAWVAQRARPLALVAGTALLVGVIGNRASLVHDYATAADDSRRILAHVERRWPEVPEHRIVFGPYPVMKRNIVAFIDADWPLKWLYDSRAVDAGFTLTEDAFESVPPEEQVNIVELSELEAVDRVSD